MANFLVYISDIINVSDSLNTEIDYTSIISDNINVSDGSNLWYIHKETSPDTLSISDISYGEISEYIISVLGEGILLGDQAYDTITYRPIIEDNIELSDTGNAFITYPVYNTDEFNIQTKSNANVYYRNNDSDSDISLSDSVFAIISKHTTRRFKNAIYNMLGTVEQTLYTCLNTSSTILNISFCNRLLVDIHVDVILYKGGVTPSYIAKNILVEPHYVFVINNNDENGITMEENDEIRIISDTSNSTDVYMALMEQQ